MQSGGGSLMRYLPRRRMIRVCWSCMAVAAGLSVLFINTIAELGSCEENCGAHSWLHPPNPQSEIFIQYILDKVIEPQRDSVPNPLTEKEVRQMVKIDPSAFTVNQFLLGYIGNIENGTFVDVGAGDGEFLSFSGQLEVLNNWRGLLVEPRAEAYAHLRQRRRAASANTCVTGGDYHRKHMLWRPHVDDSLSPLLQRSTRSKAALSDYVDAEDRGDGQEYLVQCFTLSSIVTAYQLSINDTLNFIDLLILDTNAGELLMMENLSIPRFRYLLVAIRDSNEYEFASNNTRSLGLRMTNKEMLQFGYALFQHESDNRSIVAVAVPAE